MNGHLHGFCCKFINGDVLSPLLLYFPSLRKEFFLKTLHKNLIKICSLALTRNKSGRNWLNQRERYISWEIDLIYIFWWISIMPISSLTSRIVHFFFSGAQFSHLMLFKYYKTEVLKLLMDYLMIFQQESCILVFARK